MNDTGSSQARGSLRGFWSLFVTQFQNAFSDNALKFLTTFIIIHLGLPQEKRDQLVPLVGLIFALPFVLFSMTGGYFADRYSKRNVIIGIKLAEIGIMTVAMIGLWQRNVPMLLGVIFLMSTHSAFFGPSKYGLLPELLAEKELSWGNGIIQMGTFIASIAGTIAAGLLSDKLGHNQVWSGVLLIGLAMLGTFTSTGISRLPAANPTKRFRMNIFGEFAEQFRLIRVDRVLLLAVIGNTFIWFLAALLQPTILFYGKDILRLEDTQSSYLQAALAVGIGVGSGVAGYVSGKKIEYGLVPLGALGLTIFGALLSRTGLSPVAVGINLGLLGFSAGFYAVPINALIQQRPEHAHKGGVIAASAFLSWIGIMVASAFYLLLASILKLTPPQVFLAGAVMTLAGAICAVRILPDSLLRLLLWFLTHTIYRIRVLGRDNIPERGGALFVCNHVSFVDAVLLLASTDRRVRFMMLKEHYEWKFLNPFVRILGVIPISSDQRPREMIKSLQTAEEAIRAGEVVCIFAEGQITRIGNLLPFRRGFERIMKDVEAPIIPVGLDGVWGSIFSFEKGKFLWKVPRRLPYPVTINYGKPMPHTATPFEVRAAVQELLAEAWRERKRRMRTLPIAMVNTARRYPSRFAMADAQNPGVSFGSALVRTVLLARRLRKTWANQKMVGLLLPPSVPGALVNHAAMLLNKVPVNLNYTVSEETLAACIRQCEIRTVISSKAFLDKLKLKVPCETVMLEEVIGMERRSPIQREGESEAAGLETGAPFAGKSAPPSFSEKTIATLISFLVPDRWLQRLLGAEAKSGLDDLATIIFSSGSTGEPKGVMLSHYNVGSNVGQLEQVFGLNARDRLLGVLPFFHSFGFTGTLCLPAVLGAGVVFHPNPLDAKTIGPLVREQGVTFLLATPTFLQLYMRGCDPADFGSLRVVMTGAEKLPDRLAIAFEEQFGIHALEGYGCTECAPAVAVNTHDFRSAGFRQVGYKRGKIGHPVPGVSIRIVDPQTRAPLPMGQPGLMLVQGPNVMQGYLGKPEKTADVLIDSPGAEGKWYVTGDIAAIDEDGFLQITDRLSRFSKIGGEMVPHIKVEEKLHELAGATEQTFVVTGLPDEKKGERLVVLHKLSNEALPPCLEKLSQTDLPNLWKPRADQFFHVDAFPYLGTGKLDLRKVKDLANQLGGGR
jgi:acyl-[acyl-carrier-protein]-phospholipid O-acyltransferase / long-chain-fatty-acid--[acyl-carrier-protein] ligase